MQHPKRPSQLDRKASAKLSRGQREILLYVYDWQAMIEAISAMPDQIEKHGAFYPRYLAAGYPIRAVSDPIRQASLARLLRTLEERGLLLRVRPSDPKRDEATHFLFPSGPRPDIQPTNVVLTDQGMRVARRLHQEKYQTTPQAVGDTQR